MRVAGVPASSLPCGPAADGMPAGLQIVGRAGEDGHVMALGTAIERLLPALRPAGVAR